MRLKRLYDWDAPAEEWVPDIEVCPVCRGKGRVPNEEMTKFLSCPVGLSDKEEHYWHAPDGRKFAWIHEQDEETGNYFRARRIPPVSGVEIERVSKEQKFSTRLVDQAKEQGWMIVGDDVITIKGRYVDVHYRIERAPGRYRNEVLREYQCGLIDIVERDTEE